MGVGNDSVYNKTRCLETFPLPAEDTGLTTELTVRIRTLAEQIDAHRKAQLTIHADAALTVTYNVLEKLRCGEALTNQEKIVHEHGLVGVLKSLHDELDAAVLQAYGWNDLTLPADTQTLLVRLVALNAKRAAEEAAGTVRWLRPELQDAGQSAQASIDSDEAVDSPDEDTGVVAPINPVSQRPWAAGITEQIKSVGSGNHRTNQVRGGSAARSWPTAGPRYLGRSFQRSRQVARSAPNPSRHTGCTGART
jgi:hypothetical protein